VNQPLNRRILIVDDNDSIHADFRKIIGAESKLSAAVDAAAAQLFDEPVRLTPEQGSFQIDSAHQGQEGLERVRQAVDAGRPYAVAFVDVRMPPGWDGIETIKRIWQVDPDLQVVVCTAYSDYAWSEMIDVLGETDRLLILKKPFDNIEVRQLASALVVKWQLAHTASHTMQELRQMVREQTSSIRVAHEETIHRLIRASLYRDEETGAHIRRTGLYSELLAARAGWDAGSVELLRLAAPMHDIGKIGIPDAILRKPGPLTCEEMEILKTHATLGARMLAGSSSPVLRLAHDIALCHHERWDGGGYPAGLAGNAISEAARIVAIVDVYDALTHDRVYRHKVAEAEVLNMMRAERGRHFDPQLFDHFLSLLPQMRFIAETEIDEETDSHSGGGVPEFDWGRLSGQPGLLIPSPQGDTAAEVVPR
jgi:putative two-component system response regulator